MSQQEESARSAGSPLTFRPAPVLRERLLAYAKQAARSYSSVLSEAVTEYLDRRDGITAPAPASRGNTARKPRARPVPPPATFKPAEPESASDIMAALRRRRDGAQ